MGVRFRSSSRRISHRFQIIFNTNSRNMEESKKSPVDELFTEIILSFSISYTYNS